MKPPIIVDEYGPPPDRRGSAHFDWPEPPRGLALALQFLTVVPMRVPDEGGRPSAPAEQGGPMSGALPWFPVVGALLGVALALADWLLAHIFSLAVRDALLLALVAGITGMLHLDGFIDCCDGLLGVRSVERRLEILRDSRVGAYGVLGAVVLLVARFAALGALPGGVRALALVLAPLLGRWAMVYAVVRFPYARSAGLGRPFRAQPAHLERATLAALGALLIAALLFGWAVPVGVRLVLGVALAALAWLVTRWWTAWASAKLGGGLTGDTYGALNELVELAVLLAISPLAIWLAHIH